MSATSPSRVHVLRDFFLGLVGLICGRLFTTLNPPRVDLTGKVAIITGSNSGIGLQVALGLARRGATVYLACRSASKGEEAASLIVSEVPASKGRVKSLILDISSLSSVRSFAETWELLKSKVDILFHNAGIASTPPGLDFTADGFPMSYATNFLGSFLLTYLLEPYLSVDARIILTSSIGHYQGTFNSAFSLNRIKDLEPGFHFPSAYYKAGKAPPDAALYFQSKAMQAAFARLLQNHFDRKAAEAGVRSCKVAHAFHPGFTLTPVFGKMPDTSFFAGPSFWLLKLTSNVLAVDASQGAATGVWLAGTNDETVIGEGMGGGYWDRMSRRLSSVDIMGKDKLERLWVRWEADAGVEWR